MGLLLFDPLQRGLEKPQIAYKKANQYQMAVSDSPLTLE